MIEAPLPQPAATTDGAANAMVRTGDGRRLLGAQVCDHFALGLGIVAFPWLVLDGGGGPSLAGLVFTVAAIPYVLFGLPAGVAGDRYSRKKMMVGGHLGQALCAGLLPLWALGASPPVALVLACAFAVGVGRTFADAASFGAVADVVGPANYAQGQAALSSAWAAGSIAGPFAGGILVASIALHRRSASRVGPSSSRPFLSAAFVGLSPRRRKKRTDASATPCARESR